MQYAWAGFKKEQQCANKGDCVLQKARVQSSNKWVGMSSLQGLISS